MDVVVPPSIFLTLLISPFTFAPPALLYGVTASCAREDSLLAVTTVDCAATAAATTNLSVNFDSFCCFYFQCIFISLPQLFTTSSALNSFLQPVWVHREGTGRAGGLIGQHGICNELKSLKQHEGLIWCDVDWSEIIYGGVWSKIIIHHRIYKQIISTSSQQSGPSGKKETGRLYDGVPACSAATKWSKWAYVHKEM